MKKDITVTAKTVEDAALEGASQLGVAREDVEIEVLEEPKKGFFGMGAAPAKVKVTYILKPLEAARNFIETLMADLEIQAEIQIHDDGNGESLITIEGEGASILIGHHGDTLEAFQYLVNLAANKKDDEDRQYTRITVNIENYREKREETLRKLAAKMAAKVKKTGRNIALEPMNAYERRIIHAEIQKIEGVSTNSVGTEGNRRVVIFPEGNAKPTELKPEKKQQKRSGERREKSDRRDAKPSYDKSKSERREKPSADKSEARNEPKKEYSYKRPDTPRPAPRKIEKAKDLDSYFAKLKEFSSNNPQ
ncbi:MAG: Jag N-terminal domain-containing protein [Clostridia bacterium]|nr:Jag N-terminal domain-containing protein [Clostridia bacterium]